MHDLIRVISFAKVINFSLNGRLLERKLKIQQLAKGPLASVCSGLECNCYSR